MQLSGRGAIAIMSETSLAATLRRKFRISKTRSIEGRDERTEDNRARTSSRESTTGSEAGIRREAIKGDQRDLQ